MAATRSFSPKWESNGPSSLVVDDTSVYVLDILDVPNVFQVPLAGEPEAGPPNILTTGGTYPLSLAEYGTTLYWTQQGDANGELGSSGPFDGGVHGQITSMPKDGSSAPTSLSAISVSRSSSPSIAAVSIGRIDSRRQSCAFPPAPPFPWRSPPPSAGETPYKYIDGWYLGWFVYRAFKALREEKAASSAPRTSHHATPKSRLFRANALSLKSIRSIFAGSRYAFCQRTAQCRCGPVTRPVAPLSPSSWPAIT